MNDRLLIFDPSSGDVTLSPQGAVLACFKALKEADGTKVQNTFSSQLKALFYLYSPDSPYYDRYTPYQRRDVIYGQIIKQKPSKIETPEFQSCEKVIMRHGMSREEAQFQQLQIDFDKFLDHLNSIPWEREIVETTHMGKKETVKVTKVSNMEERLRAIKASKDILQLQKELEVIVAGKRRASEQATTKTRNFEDPEYIKMIDGRTGN